MRGWVGVLVCLLVVPASPAPALQVDPAVAFAPHPPILVDGNAGFALPASGVRGGSGTPDDPYRIAGWMVAGATTVAVRLVNTTAHAILEDLYFPSEGTLAAYAACAVTDPGCPGGSMIRLDGASNVTIRHVGIRFVNIGIHLRGAHDVRVEHVSIGSPDDPRARSASSADISRALVIQDSSRVSVEDLTIWRATFSLYIQRSHDLNFARLYVESSDRGWLDSTADLTFVDSTWNESRMFETRGHHEGLTIARSRFAGRATYLTPTLNEPSSASYVSGVLICGNEFTDPITPGIGGRGFELPRSDNVTIRGNRFHGAAAFRLAETVDSRVDDNLVETSAASLFGISLRGRVVARNNVFEAAGPGAALTNGVDAAGNWWGSPDGPSRDAPGNGTAVARTGSISGAPSIVEPWLTARPAPPVDPCGPREEPAGPWAFVAPVGADIRAAGIDKGVRVGDGVALP